MRYAFFLCMLSLALIWGALGVAQSASFTRNDSSGALLTKEMSRAALLARWEKDERESQMGALYESLKNPGSLEGVMTAIDFLKKRIFDQGVAHPVYYLAHAQLLWMTGDKKEQETALLSAGIGLLLLQTDRTRCTDETAGQDLSAATKKALAAPLSQLFSEPLPLRQKHAALILDQEEARMSRPPDRWVCADAKEIQEQTLSALRDKGVPDRALDVLDRAELPAIGGIQIPIVSNETWQSRRKQERTRFKAALLGEGG